MSDRRLWRVDLNDVHVFNVAGRELGVDVAEGALDGQLIVRLAAASEGSGAFVSGLCGICCGAGRFTHGAWCTGCGGTGVVHMLDPKAMRMLTDPITDPTEDSNAC